MSKVSSVQSRVNSLNVSIKHAIALDSEMVRTINAVLSGAWSINHSGKPFVGNVYTRPGEDLVVLLASNDQMVYACHCMQEDFVSPALGDTRTQVLALEGERHFSVPMCTVRLFGGIKAYLDMLYTLADGREDPSFITNPTP